MAVARPPAVVVAGVVIPAEAAVVVGVAAGTARPYWLSLPKVGKSGQFGRGQFPIRLSRFAGALFILRISLRFKVPAPAACMLSNEFQTIRSFARMLL
jgi:hypothetical protein